MNRSRNSKSAFTWNFVNRSRNSKSAFTWNFVNRSRNGKSAFTRNFVNHSRNSKSAFIRYFVNRSRNGKKAFTRNFVNQEWIQTQDPSENTSLTVLNWNGSENTFDVHTDVEPFLERFRTVPRTVSGFL